MVQTVREFVNDTYQLIDAHSPTVPLEGDDQKKAIQFLNELLQYYSANGLLVTINKEVSFSAVAGTQTITYGNIGSGYDVEQGIPSYIQSAWAIKENITYPLILENRNIFDQSFKYQPLQGLPRYGIFNYKVDHTELRLYPAPSEQYDIYIKGKFQNAEVTSNDDMSGVPLYYIRFLRFALARDLALYKGRADAWTDKLESRYIEAEREMIAATPVNVKTQSNRDSNLNGAALVRSGAYL